ncbi:MAG: enoyl-CoA hydratase/isomerase family protein [Deltaproteobacteria bacterium]|nr:enoyl-CoA hydratase/isomerase family protein [Deltaproteobacteria bacterium]
MEYTTIQYEMKDGIARIRLNRPEVLNAWNWKMMEEVSDVIDKLNKDKEARVLIISGNGKAFCAGHDLKELETEKGYPSDFVELMNYERAKYIDPKEALRRLKIPSIAQVHGHVLAGAFVIMNMCDLVIAAEGTRMGMYGVKFGPPPDENMNYLWLMPLRIVKEMVYTGRIYSAEEFYRIGLINKVVPAEKLEEEVNALAKEITDINPVNNRLTKESINLMLDIMGYSATQQTGSLYHFIGHQLFTGGQMGKDLFRAQKELGTKWFIQKTKEGMFRDFDTEKRILKEALAELDAREKDKTELEGE